MSSTRAGQAPMCPVRPEQATNATTTTEEAEEGDEVKDELVKRAEELDKRIGELENKLVREEGRRPIVSPVPERPTELEVKEHNVTHTPPKPWCPYCTAATGKRDPHPRIKKEVPDVEVPIDKVPTLSVDYT